MVDQVAYRVGLAAIPRRSTERAMWHNQINDNETATPANDRVLQASESFPARRGLLRRPGSMILHGIPPYANAATKLTAIGSAPEPKGRQRRHYCSLRDRRQRESPRDG